MTVLALSAVVFMVGCFFLYRLGLAGSRDAARDAAGHLVGSLPIPSRRLPRVLLREAKRTVTVGVSGSVLVPPLVEISINPQDLVAFRRARSWLESDVEAGFRREARKREWTVLMTPRVEIQDDPDRPRRSPLARGRFDVDGWDSSWRSEMSGGTSPAPEQTEPMPVAAAHISLLRAEGPDVNLYLTAGDAVIVGRSRVCDVHLNDDQVSGKHCRLQFDGETVHVTDLDSTNGVLVNGTRVTSAILQTHDRIGFGDVRFHANVQVTSPRP